MFILDLIKADLWLNLRIPVPGVCAFVLDVLDAAPAGTQPCYTAITFIYFHSCHLMPWSGTQCCLFFILSVYYHRALLLKQLTKVNWWACWNVTGLCSGRDCEIVHGGPGQREVAIGFTAYSHPHESRRYFLIIIALYVAPICSYGISTIACEIPVFEIGQPLSFFVVWCGVNHATIFFLPLPPRL